VLQIKPRQGPTVGISVLSFGGVKAQGTIEGKLQVWQPLGPGAKTPDLGPFEAWLEIPDKNEAKRRVRVSDKISLAY